MNYANYRDGQNRIIGGHIGIINYRDIELPKCQIGIMLIIEMAKIELTGGHIGFMLIIEIAKIELKLELCTGGHERRPY